MTAFATDHHAEVGDFRRAEKGGSVGFRIVYCEHGYVGHFFLLLFFFPSFFLMEEDEKESKEQGGQKRERE